MVGRRGVPAHSVSQVILVVFLKSLLSRSSRASMDWILLSAPLGRKGGVGVEVGGGDP